MNALITKCLGFFVAALVLGQTCHAELLYSAPLRNGDYGAGFKVGAYQAGNAWNESGSSGGDLSALGIVDSAEGVTYTTTHDVINFSLGADGKNRTQFRATGTVSVWFKADLSNFESGQPFVDNYGFRQFNYGQANFGTGMSRNAGVDGQLNTSDDRVELSWNTLHTGPGGPWRSHIDTANDEVLLNFDQWHHLGLTWGGAINDFEVWVDGSLMAFDNLATGVASSWGGSTAAYNFALGEIHERAVGDDSTYGITYAELEIWNEYRESGNTSAAVPEPTSLVLFCGLGVMGLVALRRKRRLAA